MEAGEQAQTAGHKRTSEERGFPMSTVSSTFKVALLAFGLILLLSCAPTGDARASDAGESPRTMTISATGMAAGRPDLATINVGVITQGETAEEALKQNNQKMTALIASLEKAGLKKKDIQTSRFDVQPQYAKSVASYNSRGKISGYQVTNQVSVTVRDLERLGIILDQVTKAGANQIYGIGFGFSDPQPLLDKAGQEAIKEARRKALLYAEAAGVQLGKVLALNESGGGRPEMKFMRAESMAMDSVPVAVGESSVSASVSITFELK